MEFAGDTDGESTLSAIEQQLVTALDQRDLDRFRNCLRDGVNPNIEAYGMPLLIYAALRAEPEFLREMITAGVNLKCRMAGKNAIMWLSWLGVSPKHVECADVLITAGVDLTTRSKQGGTALDMAISWRHTDIALLLQANGAPCSKASVQELRALKANRDQDRSGGKY